MAQPEAGDVYQIEVINHPILDLILTLLESVPGRWDPERVGDTVRFRAETGLRYAIVVLPTEQKG